MDEMYIGMNDEVGEVGTSASATKWYFTYAPKKFNTPRKVIAAGDFLK
jgi:hypothetical protein